MLSFPDESSDAGANYMRTNLITLDPSSRNRMPKNVGSTPQPANLESSRHRVHGIAQVADSLQILIMKVSGAGPTLLSDWVRSLHSFYCFGGRSHAWASGHDKRLSCGRSYHFEDRYGSCHLCIIPE
jgi:hypothetical protein